MIEKQQWIVLPAKMIQDMFGMRLFPLGLVPQWGGWDWMILDYSYFDVNQQTLNIAPKDAMHFGPVYMSKVDLSNGFYCL